MRPETSTITGKEARAQMVMFLTGARDIGGVSVETLTTRFRVRRHVAEAALCDEMRRRGGG